MNDRVISFIQPSRNNLKKRILDTDMRYVGLMISQMMVHGSG